MRPGLIRDVYLRSCGRRASCLGFGCWQLGSKGWGAADERELKRTVELALARGVRLFDTAPVYGFGRSESLLGKLLHRSDAIVVSKGGLVWDERGRVRHDNRPESLREQLRASLARLRRDCLDVYLLHWPDPAVPLTESVEALDGFRRDGLIRGWGVSNHRETELASLDSSPASGGGVLLELSLNVLDAGDQRALLPRARDRDWDVIAFDVLARGILAGNYSPKTRFGRKDVRRKDPRFSADCFTDHLARAARVRELAARRGVAAAALAIAAVQALPGVRACLVGMKSPAQLEENLESERIELDDHERTLLWPSAGLG